MDFICDVINLISIRDDYLDACFSERPFEEVSLHCKSCSHEPDFLQALSLNFCTSGFDNADKRNCCTRLEFIEDDVWCITSQGDGFSPGSHQIPDSLGQVLRERFIIISSTHGQDVIYVDTFNS